MIKDLGQGSSLVRHEVLGTIRRNGCLVVAACREGEVAALQGNRLARQRGGMDIAEMAALDALRRARSRPLRVEAVGKGNVQARGLATGEAVPAPDGDVGDAAAGVALARQLALAVAAAVRMPAGPRLDEAGLAVATGFAALADAGF